MHSNAASMITGAILFAAGLLIGYEFAHRVPAGGSIGIAIGPGAGPDGHQGPIHAGEGPTVGSPQPNDVNPAPPNNAAGK